MEGCQYCVHPELFEAYEMLNEDYVPGAELVKDYDEEIEECVACRRSLLKDDFIINYKEEFLDESLKYLASKINTEIYECQYCNWTIIPYEQRNGDPLNLKMVRELLGDYGIPSDLQSRMYKHLHCSCGNPVSYDDPYVTESEMKNWFNEEIEFIVETFNISGEETEEFIDYLQENPMLGLAHPVGEIIFNKIKCNDFPGIETLKSGSSYYRGRTRNKFQRLVPFIEDELWNPPIGIPQQGRFNPPGVTNLYLGDQKDAILLEIAPSPIDVVDIAEFEIAEELKVFNSTKTDIDIFAGLTKLQNGLSFSYEYIFPNFLSQCLSFHGFKGIVYKSVKDETALNLCLFDFQRDTDIKMTKIHTNENMDAYDDHFGIKPRKETIEIEPKTLDLTALF